MANEMRDRLVELIKQAKQKTKNANCDIERNMLFADHLIENGVIVPPCKEWDTVWYIKEYRVPNNEYRMSFHSEWELSKESFHLSMMNNFGKTVFLTKAEAEQKLKEMRGG